MPDGNGSRVWVTGPFVQLELRDDRTAAIIWRSMGFLGRRNEREVRPSEITVQRARGRGRTKGLRLDTTGGDVFYLWCSARVQEEVAHELSAEGAQVESGEFEHNWLRVGIEDYRSRRAS